MNYKKVADDIQGWIENKVVNAECEGVVLGVSGGIDSAVVAQLAVNALGDRDVIGIVMPCNSNAQDKTDGYKIIKHIGISDSEITDLTAIYKLLMKTGTMFYNKMTSANLKSRLRMCYLYMIANNCNCLVIGTSNKTEIALGYYTKYGDGGVDIEPIGDLYKTEVWELGRYLGLPEWVIDKAPSAGLWSDQTDERELGMSYIDIDCELLKTPQERNGGLLERIKSTEHKRVMPEVCELGEK